MCDPADVVSLGAGHTPPAASLLPVHSFGVPDADGGCITPCEEASSRERLLSLSDGEEEIFFGPQTNREKLKAKKLRRKTEIFRPGFRQTAAVVENEEISSITADEATSCAESRLDGDGGSHAKEMCKHLNGQKNTFNENVANTDGYPNKSGLVTAINVASPVLSVITTLPQTSTDDAATLFSAMGDMIDESSVLREESKREDNSVGSPHHGLQSNGKECADCGDSCQATSSSPQKSLKEKSPVALAVGEFSQGGTGRATKQTEDKEGTQRLTKQHSSSSTPVRSSLDAIVYPSPLQVNIEVQEIQAQQPVCQSDLPISASHSVVNGKIMSTSVSPGSSWSKMRPHKFSEQRTFSAFTPLSTLNHVSSLHEVTEGEAKHPSNDSNPMIVSSPATTISRCLTEGKHSSALTELPKTLDISQKENISGGPQVSSLSSGAVPSEVSRPFSSKVLQVSTQHQMNVSPSVVRQQLIEKKRALLAQLRAQKQELKDRIQKDNEKCFSMKLENAKALHSNMSRGSTPSLERLPARGCSGLAALTLTEHELELVTKLHTITNGQRAASEQNWTPHLLVTRKKGCSRLHWHEDLVLVVEDLSSPSRPRGTARPILSMKRHNLSGQETVQPGGKPRAKQQLMFR